MLLPGGYGTTPVLRVYHQWIYTYPLCTVWAQAPQNVEPEQLSPAFESGGNDNGMRSVGCILYIQPKSMWLREPTVHVSRVNGDTQTSVATQ